MPRDTDSRLQGGRDAVNRHAWREAFDLLSGADASASLAPEDLEGLARAAWWSGRLGACIAARERAYAAYVEAGQSLPAARIGIALASDYFAKRGEPALGMAWLNRAERLLQDQPTCIEHGYLARMRGFMAFEGRRELDAAFVCAQQAIDIGTRFRDRDLTALGLHDKGRVLIALGRVAEGTALMDEATAAAISGELGQSATAIIYCHTLKSCIEMADYGRAGEWSEAAGRWCERQAITGFPGMCRVYQATVLRLRGAWLEAEREAARACDELRDFHVAYAAESLYEIGEVRCRVGDLAAAEEAFRRAHELGREPEPGLSLLRLVEGNVSTAARSIKRALASEPDRLRRARLLPAQVEIAIATADLEVARTATEELESIAAAFGFPAFNARAASARGALQLAEGDVARAEQTLRRAWHLWLEIECPYEAARIRVLLAAACRAEGDEDAWSLELSAAKAAFGRLGAVLDVRRAADLLREPGRAQSGGFPLTAREREVAVLITRGFTNRQISQKLYVTERTAETHVEHILTKLGFHSRSQIAAWTAQHGLARQPSD